MASLYSRPIYNLRLPGHYRLQHPRGEPVFDVPINQLHATTETTDRAAPPASGNVQVPPPAYTGLQLPLVRTTSSGRTLVNSTGSGRRSKALKIAWAYHPAISGRWYSYRLFRFLKKDREALQSEFPDEFEEVLDEGNVDLAEQEKIRELFSARIHHLNEWILQPLTVTRLWMALVEIFGTIVFTYLIVALAITGGTQKGVLEGAEVALIVFMVFAAGLVNHTRIRRWRLQSDLRMLSREWSPMPTSSTTPQMVRAYLGETNYQELDIEASAQAQSLAQSLVSAAQEEGLKPCMRWTMIKRDGSVWTSWRPVVMVELIVPNGSRNSLAPSSSAQAVPSSPVTRLEEDYVPMYSPRQAAGERTVQFAQ